MEVEMVSKANQEVDGLVSWVQACKGDVDHRAFRDACGDIAVLASFETGLRIPSYTRGRGAIALDWACSALNRPMPSEILYYRELPGVRLGWPEQGEGE
jgi:hypothetical protein